MLILASASPRRRELLETAGYRIEVAPARVEEWEDAAADPAELVMHNARLKAAAVSRERPAWPVMAADTTVALGRTVLNKPADWEEARQMLRTLSGQTHVVHTAVVLLWADKEIVKEACVTSRVTFKKLTDYIISEYFALVNPLDKAGAYGIQEGSERIIARYEGSYSNIMGLPMETVTPWLEAWPELRVI